MTNSTHNTPKQPYRIYLTLNRPKQKNAKLLYHERRVFADKTIRYLGHSIPVPECKPRETIIIVAPCDFPDHRGGYAGI